MVREQHFAAEKRRIGLAAADLIQPNETVGITAGATTTYIGRALRHRDQIQVITNAINIGMELCNLPGIRTCLTGGAVTQAWSFSLTGNAAIEFLEDVHLDRVFVSVTRIDAARGATTLEAEEALFYRKMVDQAKQVVAVADSSKLGKPRDVVNEFNVSVGGPIRKDKLFFLPTMRVFVSPCRSSRQRPC